MIKKINKEAKDEIMSKGLLIYDYERIPFTSPRMNYCTHGGLPVGRLIEFYGEEHGGKTTTALDIVANYQHLHEDREVMWIDAENTLDAEWAKTLGVDVERLYIIQPKGQSAEDIFQMIEDAIKTGEVGLWVLDSIGALASSKEWEKDYNESTVAGISGPLTRFSKKIEPIMYKHQCTGIGINQQRDKIGSPYGGKKTPGGDAWKHFCSVRMEFRKGDYIDADGKTLPRSSEDPVGQIVLMTMKKNKTCPPDRRTGFFTLNYQIGIDYLRDLLDVGEKYGIVEKSGAWYKLIDIETGEILREKIQGQAKLHSLLNEDTELLQAVETLVDNALNS